VFKKIFNTIYTTYKFNIKIKNTIISRKVHKNFKLHTNLFYFLAMGKIYFFVNKHKFVNSNFLSVPLKNILVNIWAIQQENFFGITKKTFFFFYFRFSNPFFL